MNLTDEELEAIADRVADKLQERFYADLGRRMVKKFFWIVGLTVVAGVTWVSQGRWFQ